VPAVEGSPVAAFRACCRGGITRAEWDDDINYTVLALHLLEQNGAALRTVDVARAWLRLLPVGMVFTAERAAYGTLVAKAHEYFHFGTDPGFDLSECSDNPYNEWIGAQIRADLYGWVCPGRPELAAELARRDAALSHRGEGVHGAMFVAALGAALPAARDLDAAIDAALTTIPADSQATEAVRFGRSLAGEKDAVARLHERYAEVSPVHTLNNLALVVWALAAGGGDFGAAVGDAVAAGWDTDCNGATVGGLFGLSADIPEAWTRPWRGRVCVTLAGHAELALDELVERTVAVARSLA
jgi:ADP-ribosylglycohydrolase